jgi:hypothetical protein
MIYIWIVVCPVDDVGSSIALLFFNLNLGPLPLLHDIHEDMRV